MSFVDDPDVFGTSSAGKILSAERVQSFYRWENSPGSLFEGQELITFYAYREELTWCLRGSFLRIRSTGRGVFITR